MGFISQSYFFIMVAALFVMGLLYLGFLRPAYIPHFLVLVYLLLPLFYSLTGINRLPLTLVFVLVLMPIVLFKSSFYAIFKLWVYLPYIFSVIVASVLNNISLIERKSALIPIVISMICYLSFARTDSEKPLIHFVYVLIVWGLINSVFSVLQIFVSDIFYVISVNGRYVMSGIKRGYGLVGMATQIGFQLCFIVSLLVAVAVDRSNKKVVFYMSLSLLILGLVLTFSRAAILGTCVSIAIILFLLERKKLLILYVGGGFVLGIVYIVYLNLLPDNYSFFLQGEDSSAKARVHFVKIGINMFLDKPLWGWGYGGFTENVVKYGSSHRIEAHNTFIQVLVEYGIVGFSAFMFLIIKSIKGYWRCFKNCGSHEMKVISVGFFASLTAVLVDSYFHCFEWNLLFWLAVTMGFVMHFHHYNNDNLVEQ